jgi:cell division protein FtsL
MVADFIIAVCAIGILICAIYIVYQAKKLKYEKRLEKLHSIAEEKQTNDDVYASIEEEI